MLKILWQVLHHDVELVLEHGLDDEPPIMRKKEEAAGLALRLAGLEDSFVVQMRCQGHLDVLVLDAIHLSQFFEFAVSEVGNAYFFVYDLLLRLHADHIWLAKLRRGLLPGLASLDDGGQTALSMLLVIALAIAGNVLVVFGHVPFGGVVDFDLIELHDSNLFELVYVLHVFLLLLSKELNGLSVVFGKVFQLVRIELVLEVLEALLFAGEARDPHQNDIHQFNVEAGGEERRQNLGLNPFLRLIFDKSKIFVDLPLYFVSIKGVKCADHDHHEASEEHSNKRNYFDPLFVGSHQTSLLLTVARLRVSKQLIVVVE